MTTPKLTYRVSSVCAKLDVSRATVYRMAKNGSLKLVKISGSCSKAQGASGITAESLENHMRQIGQSA